MSDTNDRFSNFSKEVIKQAESKRDDLMNMLNRQRDAALLDAKRRYENDAKNYINAKKSEAQSVINQEISKKTLENRKNLLMRRDAIVHEVMCEVENKIIEFSKSDEYIPFLISEIADNRSYIFAGETTLIVSEKDYSFVDYIKQELVGKHDINADDIIFKKSGDIKLGGFILENKKQNIIIDATLDNKLSEQNEYFAQISGLTLG